MRLEKKDRRALKEFKDSVTKEFPEAEFILFGSKARGQDEESSDLDVLVLLNGQINTAIEQKIFGIGFETGLKRDVVFGIIVEEKNFWSSSLAKVMPFYQNVIHEGVKV